MGILLVGMNHRTAPLQMRERLSRVCGEGVEADLPKEISTVCSIQEVLTMVTCNRIEVVAWSDDHDGAVQEIKDIFQRRGNFLPGELDGCLYAYDNLDAVRHLFRVAASLDSMVIGEPQILGQVKEAYRQAVGHGTTGVILNKVLHHAFRVAKRVRTETAVAGHAVSVSYAAVELAKKIFGSLEDKTVMLVGAGEMSELAARNLIKHGVQHIVVANRTFDRAVQLAAKFQGTAAEFDRLAEKLGEADIIISSTGAPGYLVTADMVRGALRRRKNRLLFLVDIAVPRDIDPAAGEIDNVFLYNIDDLQDIADENRQLREREAERADAIVEEEVAKHDAWFHTLSVVPTIVALREQAEAIIKGEIERSSPWLQALSEVERQRVEILAKSIVNKILHGPITGLKDESRQHGTMAYVAALRTLFRLDE